MKPGTGREEGSGQDEEADWPSKPEGSGWVFATQHLPKCADPSPAGVNLFLALQPWTGGGAKCLATVRG